MKRALWGGKPCPGASSSPSPAGRPARPGGRHPRRLERQQSRGSGHGVTSRGNPAGGPDPARHQRGQAQGCSTQDPSARRERVLTRRYAAPRSRPNYSGRGSVCGISRRAVLRQATSPLRATAQDHPGGMCSRLIRHTPGRIDHADEAILTLQPTGAARGWLWRSRLMRTPTGVLPLRARRASPRSRRALSLLPVRRATCSSRPRSRTSGRSPRRALPPVRGGGFLLSAHRRCEPVFEWTARSSSYPPTLRQRPSWA